MPEIVAVPAPQVTEVWVVENHEIEFLGLEPQPPVELIVVQQIEVVALVDTGKGDTGPQGPVGQSVIPFVRDGNISVTVGSQPYRFPFDATLLGISGCWRVPNTGAVVFDINVDGVTIFPVQSDRPVFPARDSDLPELSLNVPIVSGNRLTIDVDDTGGSFDGEDLSVFVRYVETV